MNLTWDTLIKFIQAKSSLYAIMGATFKTQLKKLSTFPMKVVRAIAGATYNAHNKYIFMIGESLN